MTISVEKTYPEGGNSISAKWLQPWLRENAKRELIARVSHARVEPGLKGKPVIVLSHAQSEREAWLNATNAAILKNEIDDDAEQWVGHRVAYSIIMGQNPDGHVGPQVRVRCADHDAPQPQSAQSIVTPAPTKPNAYAQASQASQPNAGGAIDLNDEIPF